MKPLCIDLFCGLFQAQFFRRADTLIQQFMAGGAQNPDHMRLRVLHLSPCAVALESRPVSQFKHSTFPATAKPAFSGLAPERAVLFINPACNEFSATRTAG